MERVFKTLLVASSSLLLACAEAPKDAPVVAEPRTEAPEMIDKSPNKITIHGVTLEDEYSWWKEKGEDGAPHPHIQSLIAEENEKTESFFTQYNEVLENVFDTLKRNLPQDVLSRTRNMGNFEVTPTYLENNDYPTYIALDPNTGEEFVLLDQNAQAGNSNYYLMTDISISPDGTKVLWVEDTVGNDEFNVYVKTIGESGSHFTKIQNADAYAVWTADSQNVVYVTQTDNSFMLYNLNEKSASRIEVPDTEEAYSIPDTTTSGKYIKLNLYMRGVQEVWVLDSENPSSLPTLVLSRDEPGNYSLDYGSDDLFYLFNSERSNEIQTFRLSGSEKTDIKMVFEAPEGSSIDTVSFYNDYLLIKAMVGMSDSAFVFNKATGETDKLEFDQEVINISLPWNEQNRIDNIARLKYQSVLTPPTYVDIELTSGERRIVRETVIDGFDPKNYKISILNAPSHDGVNVPITLVQHVDNIGKSDLPLWLYVYGSYGDGIRADFIDYQMPMINNGFNLAIAHVRGGDELGIEWHQQGRLMQRKNSMKDYLAVADYLIESGRASTGNIFASGESAGGQIIGYAINERPELFHSAGGLVPVVDFLNALMDLSIPYTRSERQEFGNPEASEEAFNYILSYSPYENIREQRYPNIYVTASIDDPGVPYWGPAKWLYRIREKQTNESTTMILINDGGHVLTGKYANQYSFARQQAFFIVMHQLDNAEESTSE